MAADEQMAGPDRAWLLMERPTNPMVVVVLIVLGTRVEYERLRRTVADRFLSFERLRRRPVADALGARWVEVENFELDDHVTRVALPANADQAELERLVGELASSHLSAERPLWSFHLVESYGPGSALIVRIHHCYADGIALVRVLLSMAEGGEPIPSAPAWTPTVDAAAPLEAFLPMLRAARSLCPPAAQLIARAWQGGTLAMQKSLDLALHPTKAAAATEQFAVLAAELARLGGLPDDPYTRLKRPLCGVKRAAWAQPIPFGEVRTISHVLGCTANDVLLATLAGGLGRYLESKGETLESRATLRATVPVNLRTGPAEPVELGNRFGLVFVPLPVGIRNPLERLYAMHAAMQAIKASQQALVTFGLLATIGSLPAVLEETAVALLSAKASLVASNVPGPSQELHLCGAPVTQLLFWVPQTGSIGTGVSILSYHEQVQFGVVADRALVAQPTELVQMIGEEFEKLVLLVLLGAGALAE